MSQAGILNVGGSSPPVLETLTGNTGGAVPPTGNNINVVGTGSITVTGNPATSTLTISINDNIVTGTATTTDGTTYVPFSASANIPLPTASTCVSIRANMAGMDTSNNLAIGGELIGCAKNVAGVVSIVGTSDLTKNNDNTLSAWTANLTSSGTNVQVEVRGVGAHTINWRCVVEYIIAP